MIKMSVYGAILPGAARVARLPADRGPVLAPLARYSFYGKGALSEMCLALTGGIVKGG